MPISDYIKHKRAKVGHDMLYMVAASGIVINEAGEILLQRRSDNGQWALPGGAIDPGEEPADAAIREIWEETGIKAIPERLLCVQGGPDYRVQYPNGDVALIVAICFLCKPVGGELQIDDDESLEVRYFAPDALPQLSVWHQQRIEMALKKSP